MIFLKPVSLGIVPHDYDNSVFSKKFINSDETYVIYELYWPMRRTSHLANQKRLDTVLNQSPVNELDCRNFKQILVVVLALLPQIRTLEVGIL